MALNIDHLLRAADTLEQALLVIGRTPPDQPVMADLFRNAATKSVELSLESAGKLPRKALKRTAPRRAASTRWSSTTCCATQGSTAC